MRLLIYIMLLICAFKSSAQKIRFTDSSNKWTVKGTAFVSVPVTVISTSSYAGDTIINGLFYRKMSGGGYIREDTITNKVFVKKQLGYDTSEVVLYDYDLKLNDTVKYITKTSINAADTYVHKVIRLDSVTINGYWHKIWTFHYLGTSTFGGYPDYIVIEGIGCNDGLTFPFSPWVFESGESIICFNTRGNDVYTGFLSAATCALSIGNNVSAVSSILTISPNPANERSIFLFPGKIRSGKLVIINTLGQIVASKDIVDQKEILLGKIQTPGIYYYRIKDNNNQQLFSGKFLYQ